jgi:hypothetical protein
MLAIVLGLGRRDGKADRGFSRMTWIKNRQQQMLRFFFSTSLRVRMTGFLVEGTTADPCGMTNKRTDNCNVNAAATSTQPQQ